MVAKEIEFRLKPQGEVLDAYMQDRSRVSCIIGALGSGKTVQTCQKIFKLMCEQEPENGVRKSRWYAVRNTYSDLLTTTVKDWRELFDDLGVYKSGSKAPPNQLLDFRLEDGTVVLAEMIFIALDRPDSVKKVRGSQLTGVWLNEKKELPKPIVDMLDLRHGRFPANPTWHGMLGDTNAPDIDHWLYNLAEKECPEDWTFFKQKGGVIRNGTLPTGRVNWVDNLDAENIHNLPRDYYKKGMQGKSDDWIAVNLANEYGFVSDGKAIYPEYRDDFHNHPLKPIEGLPIYRGWDFGTPACVMAQFTKHGQLMVFKEFTSKQTMGIDRFAEYVLTECAQLIAQGYEFIDIGDPSGDSSSMQREGDTCFKILWKAGIDIEGAPTQDPQLRIEAVRHFLCRLVDGLPAFILDGKKVPQLRKGFQGAYCYRRLQVHGEKYTDKPDKGITSHPHDCLQYICTYLRFPSWTDDEDEHDEYDEYDEGRSGVTGY